MIFVFGSNESGIHGAGAARHAYLHEGAIMGKPEGRFGNSYAIPTKDKNINYTLPLNVIRYYVNNFIKYAGEHIDEKFQVTCIGCGLAGLKHEDVAPMFKDAPDNCEFDSQWAELLPGKRLWGTF